MMYVLLNRIHNNSINKYPTSTIIYNLWYAYNLTKKEFMTWYFDFHKYIVHKFVSLVKNIIYIFFLFILVFM
jgi:hypothetical protein